MEDALQQLDALLLLQQDGLAWDAFERASRSDWFDGAAGVGGAALRHYGACAACRQGQADDARWLWESAVALAPGFALARANLDDFPGKEGQPGFPVVSDPDQTLPITWTRALGTSKADATAELDALAASNVYLRALYLGGDESFRGLIAFVLRHRAERSDPEAAGLLRELATLPVGTKDERLGFLGFLRSQGLLGRDEPASYWDGERLREIKVAGTEIYREAKKSDLPPDLEALLAEGVTLFNAKRPDEAEARLQAILDRVPDHPVALGNLAAARTMQGRDEEARDLLRRVVDRHPDYLFARCNLARTLIEEGELDEAEQLLDGLAERERLHIQEVFTVYGALAMLYAARGDHDAAKSVLASLEEMVEDEDDERRLAQGKRAVAGLDPMQRFKQVLGDVLKSGPRPGRRRR
jgi:Flp pilus assembly protein TadD